MLKHPFLSHGVDGGGEGGGVDDPNSEGNCKANKNGLGSYRYELEVKRRAFDQANKANGDLLTDLMDHNNVPEDVRCLTKEREQPKTLHPVNELSTTEKTLWIRARDPSYTRERPVWSDDKVAEVLPSRPSGTVNPLQCMALVLGGVALTSSCLKHLAHNAALHSCKLVMPFTRELASVILVTNNVWIFSRMKSVLGKIFDLKGCGPRSPLHVEVARRLKELNPKLFAEVQSRYSSVEDVSKNTEACGTRWGAIGMGSMDVNTRRPELVVSMVITFSAGLDQNRVEAAVSAWSRDGFVQNGLIQMASSKIGRAVFRLTDSAFIFGNSMLAFFHTMVHNVLQNGSSHNKESSAHVMGGVDSIIRRVYHFLTRVMWLVCPTCEEYLNLKGITKKQYFQRVAIFTKLLGAPGVLCRKKKVKKGKQWATSLLLQYKGMSTAKAGDGILMLNPAAFHSKDGRPSAVMQCFGNSFRPEMQDALENLCNTILNVSEMRFDENRNCLPKGAIRSACSGPQGTPFERRVAMIRAVALTAATTASTIQNQYANVLSDSTMFFAGLSLVDKVLVVDNDGKQESYYVATDAALANAACLYAQMKELEKAYEPQLGPGEKLGEYFHGPLRDLLLDPQVQKQLDAFRKANQVQLDRQRWSETDSYIRGADNKDFKFRPDPFSVFDRLAKLSLNCSAQPRTAQRVEGGFSLASIAFRGNRRSTGPQMWSSTIQKKNVFNFGINKRVLKTDFILEFGRALGFVRRHRKELKKIYGPDTGESEEKYEARMQATLPQYVKNGEAYKVTHISDGDASETAKALQARDRNGGRQQNSRHRGSPDEPPDMVESAGDLLRAPGPAGKRLRLPPTKAGSPQPPSSGWTLDLLNKETVETLKGMCATQEIAVSPATGHRLVKADYVAALLEAEIEACGSSLTGAQTQALDLVSDTMQELGPDCPEPMEQSNASESTPAALEVTVTTGLADIIPSAILKEAGGNSDCEALGADSERLHSAVPLSSAAEDLEAFIRDCQEGGIDPFDQNVDIDPAESEAFRRDMEERVAEEEISPDSDSEDEGMQNTVSPNDVFEQVKSRNVGVWKLEYAVALASSRSWKPSEVVSTILKKGASAKGIPNGTAVLSATMKRADNLQFTVKVAGCVFYLMNTPVGTELVKLESIFHPKGEGEKNQVFIEYSRVLGGAAVLEVCDRANDLHQTIEGHDGKKIISSSAGTKQIQLQIEERKKSGKSELYHWGDVCFIGNAANLVGAVYWVTKANENDLNDTTFLAGLVSGVKDKIPITNLRQLDRVVVGASFSDTKG